MRVDIVDGPEPRVSMDPSSNEDLMEDVTDSESRDEEYLKVLMGNRDVVGHADEQASGTSCQVIFKWVGRFAREY
jgi:hypothetical protein